MAFSLLDLEDLAPTSSTSLLPLLDERPAALQPDPRAEALGGLYQQVMDRIAEDHRRALWSPDDPIGTETIRPRQSIGMPDPSFHPGVFAGGGTVPMSQEQIDAFRSGSEDLFSQAGLLAGVGPARPGALPVAEGRVRGLRSVPPRRVSAGYETIDPAAPPPADAASPAFGIGHNNPPVRDAIWAAPQTRGGAAQPTIGRMGSNADTTLESLGLPAYGDIVPSPNTGPVPEGMARLGAEHVVKPGQVFDLSDTWRVPDVAQTDLSRIDPDAGRRKGLPEHIIQATTDPELRAKLRTVAEAGLRAGGAYWYNAEPLRLAFVTELGPEEGNATFAKYMRTVGAVSAGSDVGQNIRTASYYNVKERQGDPVRSVADLIPPYGHKMQNTQFAAYSDIAGGDPLDPAMRPKRASFDENLSGNQQPVTVDKHNLRLIGMLSQNPEFLNTTQTADVNYPTIGVKTGDKINWRDAYKSGRVTMDQLLGIPQAWKDVPEANHYAALEGFQQDLAREMNISPAQLQAALWVGGGRVTGLRSLPTSFMGAFESRLQKTAAERGGTSMKALLDFLRGKKPLLTPLAGGGLLGAAASGQPDDTQ
jgi:hypothetical protein